MRNLHHLARACALLALGVSLLVANDVITTKDVFTSLDQKFTARYRENVRIRITNNETGMYRDIDPLAIPELMLWASDSRHLASVEHIAHGSQLMIYSTAMEGKNADMVEPPNYDPECDTVYEVVQLERRPKTLRVTYKMADRASKEGCQGSYLCSFEYDPENHKASKVTQKAIAAEAYPPLKLKK